MFFPSIIKAASTIRLESDCPDACEQCYKLFPVRANPVGMSGDDGPNDTGLFDTGQLLIETLKEASSAESGGQKMPQGPCLRDSGTTPELTLHRCLPEKPVAPAREVWRAEIVESHRHQLTSALRHIVAMVLYPSPRRWRSGLPIDGETDGETQRRSRPPPPRGVPAILAIREPDVGWEVSRLVVHRPPAASSPAHPQLVPCPGHDLGRGCRGIRWRRGQGVSHRAI